MPKRIQLKAQYSSYSSEFYQRYPRSTFGSDCSCKSWFALRESEESCITADPPRIPPGDQVVGGVGCMLLKVFCHPLKGCGGDSLLHQSTFKGQGTRGWNLGFLKWKCINSKSRFAALEVNCQVRPQTTKAKNTELIISQHHHYLTSQLNFLQLGTGAESYTLVTREVALYI